MPLCQTAGITYLSLGSNIDPQKHIPAAIQLLRENFQVFGVSSIYETDPVGPAGNLKFWNLAVAIQSEDAEILRSKLRVIEARLGRVRENNKFVPRTIDIDILPQPDYQRLAFIIVPLAEIAPHEMDTETNLSFRELAEKVRDQAKNFRQVFC